VPVAARAPSFAFRRLPFGLALLVLPLSAVPVLGARCADRIGDCVVASLTAALAPLSLTPVAPDSLTATELASDAFRPMPEPATLRALASKKGSKYAARPVTRGIHVSAPQVLALAGRRALPTAVPVRATALHPAGLELHGVSTLGIGMQEGDVLTEAAGQRAASVATVVGVVLAARARHSPEINGRFYRAGVLYTLTVEQPYPPGT